MDYIAIVKDFENEQREFYNNKPGFFYDSACYIIIDENNDIRYSESRSILNTPNTLYRIIGIKIKWANNRGFYDYGKRMLFMIDENGDISKDFMIDGWNIIFDLENYRAVKNNIYFSFKKQSDFKSTIKHAWDTFKILQKCQSEKECKLFEQVYSLKQDVVKYVQELAEKNFEIDFLNKRLEQYEKLYDKISNIINLKN